MTSRPVVCVLRTGLDFTGRRMPTFNPAHTHSPENRTHVMDHQRLVDLRGLCCSAPVIKLSAEIKGMQVGEVLLAEADKDSMRKDVPAYCNQTKHELLQHEEHDGLLRFWIRKTH